MNEKAKEGRKRKEAGEGRRPSQNQLCVMQDP